MSWTELWGPYFASILRRCGRQYYEQGRVTLHPPSDRGLIRAQVRGQSHTYMVTIHIDGEHPQAECTCSQFVETHRCKHIWATLLALEADSQSFAEHGWDVRQATPRPPKARRRTAVKGRKHASEPEWASRLSLLRPSTAARAATVTGHAFTGRQICYVINQHLSHHKGALVVETRQRQLSASGWTRMKLLQIDAQTVNVLSQPIDREIGAWLLGADNVTVDELNGISTVERRHGTFALRPGAQRAALQRMVESERCFIEYRGRGVTTSPSPLVWDEDQSRSPWVLWMIAESDNDELLVNVTLRRGTLSMDIKQPDLVIGGAEGVVIYDGKVATLNDCDATRWVSQFRDEWAIAGNVLPIKVPSSDVPRFLDRLYLLPNLPELDLPPGLGRPQCDVEPTLKMELNMAASDMPDYRAGGTMTARVCFEYGPHQVKPNQLGRFLCIEGDLTLIRRDQEFEQKALLSLIPLGFFPNPADDGESLILPHRHTATAISTLTRAGWVLTANQRLLRHPDGASFSIHSSVDWFELHGGIRYTTETTEQLVSLPQILAAAKTGSHTITLNDGSQGFLPTQWLAEHSLVASMGEQKQDRLRFGINQVAILDALVADAQLLDVDAHFKQVRQRLTGFERITPEHETDGFCGDLRPYQREGLGWISFLRMIGMGGILADDMGLGKTIQVLAMLEARYCGQKTMREPSSNVIQPTLVVVPRSVVFNWIDEAKRFTPHLRVQAYTGQDRQGLREAFTDHDLIVTTYGLLRRDVAALREYLFEYVVLDEAQAIKNPKSKSAKAARLLRTNHRLALTGTPVENHLGDLWSIFEYLNPGILGSGTKFANLLRGDKLSNGPSGSRHHTLQSVDLAAQAGRVLRPFVLRRTKRQVLDELPAKTDQTLLCTMEDEQRKIYDGLLQHYQQTLLGKVRARPGAGLGASAFMVLEALLRLRQAACHPGLIDPHHASGPSAKLETLLEHLNQLVDEGHKSLVFSQFTSMLAIVRKSLDDRGMKYEYLDGKTRDRKQRIDHFQNDPECPVFLISLKAGGLGLNLTAANYVFILDPWWNPAVEIQAIDRAHRIGQTEHVFAYRMICADTVEQRIAELQDKKRKLANAIIGGESNLLGSLTKKDLEQLLS